MINRSAIHEIKKEKKIFYRLLLLSGLVALAIIGQAYGMAYLINEAFVMDTPLSNLGVGIIFTGCLIVLRIGFAYWQETTAQQLAQHTKRSLRTKVLQHMMALGPMSNEKHGQVVHLLTDGLDNVESYIARYLPQMAYAAGIPLFMGIAMIGAVPWVGILLIVTYPLIPFFMILIGKKAGKMNEEQWERMSFLSGHFLDVLQGLTTLKLFNRSTEQEAVIGRLAGEFRDSTLRVLRVAFLSSFVLELISTISTAMIAVYTGVALLMGDIHFFPAFFVLLLAPEFYLPLRELGSAFHTGMAGEVALKKCDAFLQLPIREPVSGKHVVKGAIEKIVFEGVTYTYPERYNPAIQDITFSLSSGERIMLVGESGAGKSTVAHLIMRLMSPDSGQIRVQWAGKDDLLPLEEIESSSWREQLTLVPQKPYLFRDTIANNIAFGRKVSREDIIEAAKKAEADGFIMAHPDGYDRRLGEGGTGLSGGEVQRIAIARAFLSKASVLVLDEVSAHLDVATEKAIATAMERLMEEKIVVLIGHRLETMQWADSLIVMRQGLIVQRGAFASLTAEEGYFKDLWERGGGSVAKF